MGRNSIDEYQWREGPFSPCHLYATLYNIEAEYTDFVFISSQFGSYRPSNPTAYLRDHAGGPSVTMSCLAHNELRGS